MPENADPMSALRELEAKATPGPWRYRRSIFPATDKINYAYVAFGKDANESGLGTGTLSEADARFLAAAVEYTRAALRASLAPETDRDAEDTRAFAAMQQAMGTLANEATTVLAGLRAQGFEVRRAPSLEGDRHPEAGEPCRIEPAFSQHEYAVAYCETHDQPADQCPGALAASPGARHDVPGVEG